MPSQTRAIPKWAAMVVAVVAVVALSLALVGSVVAGTSTLNKGVSKSKVKKIAKTQIKKAAPNLSVAHADTSAGPLAAR